MSLNSPISREDNWFIGEDKIFEFTVLGREQLVLSIDAVIGALILYIRPLDYSLASGDKLLFGRSIVVTLSAPALAGAVQVSVAALTVPLFVGAMGRKIINITGYALEWEFLAAPSAAVALITKTTGSGISLADPTNGRCQVSVADTDTTGLLPANGYHHLRRTDAGLEQELAYGDAILQRAGE